MRFHLQPFSLKELLEEYAHCSYRCIKLENKKDIELINSLCYPINMISAWS